MAALPPSECGEVNGVPSYDGTTCECMPGHHWEAEDGHPYGGMCVPNPPEANPLDYSTTIPVTTGVDSEDGYDVELEDTVGEFTDVEFETKETENFDIEESEEEEEEPDVPAIKGVTVTFQTYQKTDYECGEVAEYSEQEYEFMRIGMILAWEPGLISVMDSGDYDAAFTDITFANSFDYKDQNYSEGAFSEPQTMSESILSDGTYIVGTFTESFDLDPSFMTTAVVYAFAYIDIGALNTTYGTDYDSLKLILLGASEVLMGGGETETDADGWADSGYTYGNTDMNLNEDALEDQLDQDDADMQGFIMANQELNMSGDGLSETPGSFGGGSY